MNIDVPVQMTVSEGFGPVPAPSSNVLVVNITDGTGPSGDPALVMDRTWREIKAAGICSFAYRFNDGQYEVPATTYFYLANISDTDLFDTVRVLIYNLEDQYTMMFEAVDDPEHPEREYPNSPM